MDWEALIPVGVGLIGLITAVVRRQAAPSRLRDRLVLDLEIRESLPKYVSADPSVLTEFDKHIENQVLQLIRREKRQVDWVEIVIMSFSYALIGGALIWAWWEWRGWWAVGLAFGILFFVVGGIQAYQEYRNPHRGRTTATKPD